MIVLAATLVLLLPGCVLTFALLLRGTPGRVALFPVGLSLPAAILAGFVVDRTPWGLDAGAWAIALGAVIVVAGLVAAARRIRSGAEAKHRPGSNEEPRAGDPLRAALRPRDVVLMALAVGILVSAALVSVSGAREQRGSASFTELWMAPAERPGSRAVRVGVQSREAGAVDYWLEVSSGGRMIRAWPRIRLAPGETWRGEVALPPPQPQRARPRRGGQSQASGPPPAVRARLFRAGAPPGPYREVELAPDA